MSSVRIEEVEDEDDGLMLEEIETWRHYLSNLEFEDAMRHFQTRKLRFKYLNSQNPTLNQPTFLKTTRRVLIKYPSPPPHFNQYAVDNHPSSSSSSSKEDAAADVSREKEVALASIHDYFTRRNIRRQLGLAPRGLRTRGSSTTTTTNNNNNNNDVDWSNLATLVDVCCSDAAKQLQPEVMITTPPHPLTVVPDDDKLTSTKTKPKTMVGMTTSDKEKIREQMMKTNMDMGAILVPHHELLTQQTSTSRKRKPETTTRTGTSRANSKKKMKKDIIRGSSGVILPKYDDQVVGVVVNNDVLGLEYVEKIQGLNGRHVKLIEQKSLTMSDLNPGLGRLLLKYDGMNNYLNTKERLSMPIFAKLLEPMDMAGCDDDADGDMIRMNTWHMARNVYYALMKPWNKVVASNAFALGDVIQVWAFRFGDEEEDQLGVAIVPVPAPVSASAPRESTITSSDAGSSVVLC